MPSGPEKLPNHLISYFVDEAGDGVLFGPKGRVRNLDNDGPKYFMLGMISCDNESHIIDQLGELRKSLMGNPLFRTIHSMQPESNKTFRAFHAKDDHAEVRMKVFEAILNFDFRFFAVIKSMESVREYVKRRNEMHLEYRYHPNDLYDYMVRALFRQRLHLSENYRITFATRGNSKRNEALRAELMKTRNSFLQKTGRQYEINLNILSEYPWEMPCLQIADYCMWALQRYYERYECRFLEAIWPKVSLIRDLDDPNAVKAYGSYYDRNKNLPDIDKIKNRWI